MKYILIFPLVFYSRRFISLPAMMLLTMEASEL
jgi:hypothetical protein